MRRGRYSTTHDSKDHVGPNTLKGTNDCIDFKISKMSMILK
jgi:hypothetical protein